METTEIEVRATIYRDGSKITIKSESPIFRSAIKVEICFLSMNFDVVTIEFFIDGIALVIKDINESRITDKLEEFGEVIHEYVKKFKEWRDEEISKQ